MLGNIVENISQKQLMRREFSHLNKYDGMMLDNHIGNSLKSRLHDVCIELLIFSKHFSYTLYHIQRIKHTKICFHKRSMKTYFSINIFDKVITYVYFKRRI